MTSAAQPGWYPDPAGVPDRFRWWDGSTWSDATSSDRHAPTPEHTRGLEDPTVDPVVITPPEALTEDVAQPTQRSWVTRVVALSLGLVLFATAGIGIGLVVWRSPSPPTSASGTPAQDEAGSRAPTGGLDLDGRRATIGSASVVLPPDPYRIHGDPMSVEGVFDVVFLATADVHPRYDGVHTWSAAVALLSVSPVLAPDADLDEVGRTTLEELSRRMFGGQPTTLTRVRSTSKAVDGHPGLWFTAEVGYRVPRLPSTRDEVVAHVVQLEDGTVVAALGSVPDRSDAIVDDLATEAVTSLTIG